MIGIGVIGAGYWGPKHVRNFSELPGARATMVADLDERRIRAIQSQHPGIRTTSNYQDLLNSQDVDAVVIATPDHWHHRMTLDAFDAGKHVYVEKPMTWSIEQGREVVAATAKSGKLLMVGSGAKTSPLTAKAREIITELTSR